MSIDHLTLHPRALEPGSGSRGGRSGGSVGANGPSFADRLRDAVESTNRSLNEAEQNAKGLVTGETDIVETVVALSRAELQVRHLVSLRDRMLGAYQEIMRLQL